MPAPYDYTIKSTNPFLAGLQGYQMAQQQRQQAMALESQQQKIAMQQQAQQQAMAEAEMKRQKQIQFQDDVAAMPENPSSMDILNLMKKYPQMAAGYKDIQKIQSEAETKQSVMNAMTLGNYIRSGNIEGANNFLDLQIEANKNSGNDASVAGLQQIKEQLQTDPKATLISVEALAASIAGPDKFAETAQKLQETSRERYLTPDQKAKMKAEVGKLTAETAKIWNDIATMGDSEKEKRLADLDNQQREMVKTLWADIDSQLSDFRTADAANRRLQMVAKAAEKGSPAGQLAMVFNFMKINDPGSVVRETEFANAAQAKAFIEKVDNGEIKINAEALPGLGYLRKLATGQILTDTQVRDFMATSDGLWDAQQQNADMIINDIVDRAISENISPERVIGKSRYTAWQKRKESQPVETKPAKTKAPDEQKTAEFINTLPDITSREMFDSLPPGTLYKEDGKVYRK